jgi:peptide deformylase
MAPDHDHHDHDGHEHDHDELEDGGDLDDAELERAVRKRIALTHIRQYGDPVLRMRANEVESFDHELRRVAEQMIALMHDADGIGLAATQVGILRRLFVFADDGEDRVLVNPVLTKSSRDSETEEEGCLSLGPVRVPVERSVEVTIEGRNVDGETVAFDLDGLAARCVQHELDHLDGKLIIDRTDDASRRDAMRQLRPKLVLS